MNFWLLLVHLRTTYSQTFPASEVKPTNFKVGATTRYTFSVTLSVANTLGQFAVRFPSEFA